MTLSEFSERVGECCLGQSANHLELFRNDLIDYSISSYTKQLQSA